MILTEAPLNLQLAVDGFCRSQKPPIKVSLITLGIIQLYINLLLIITILTVCVSVQNTIPFLKKIKKVFIV